MRLKGWPSPLVVLLHGLAVVATAGIVHIVTIFAAPGRARHDAFARVAAMTPLNTMVHLDAASEAGQGLPFADPAMLTAACRYDLSSAPLRLAVEPFDHGFAAIGMHSRRGSAFYGLNVRAGERGAITMVLMTAAQKQADEAQDSDEGPAHDLRVLAPEAQGFVLVASPAGEGSTRWARETLDHIRCESGGEDARPQP